jgi:predicted nuclease with TOPRIM domain
MNVKSRLALLSGTDAYEVLNSEETMAEALEYIEELENQLDEQGGVINSQQKMLNEKSDIITALKKENERLLEDAKRYQFEISALRSPKYLELKERVEVTKSYVYTVSNIDTYSNAAFTKSICNAEPAFPPNWGKIRVNGHYQVF